MDDDLGLPPHPNSIGGQAFGWPGQGVQVSGAMMELVNRNRLVALNLETGKIDWERGDPDKGPDDTHDKSELAGSYFLGPPLPLAGRRSVVISSASRLGTQRGASGSPSVA